MDRMDIQLLGNSLGNRAHWSESQLHCSGFYPANPVHPVNRFFLRSGFPLLQFGLLSLKFLSFWSGH